MSAFEESHLRFEFGEGWQVLKFDEHCDYRNMQKSLPGTKGVDFVGVYGGDLYLIEIKNFRGYRIENQQRLIKGALAVEFGQKVRDSVAGIVGFRRTSSQQEIWRPAVNSLCDPEQRVKAALWLEHDLPARDPQRHKAKRSVRTKVFKQKLRCWSVIKQPCLYRIRRSTIYHD